MSGAGQPWTVAWLTGLVDVSSPVTQSAVSFLLFCSTQVLCWVFCSPYEWPQ